MIKIIKHMVSGRLMLLLALSVSLEVSIQGQDFHFSQFNNTPLALNPGLTGDFVGDIRAMTNYKNQWRSFDPSFRTISGSVDTKFDLSSQSIMGAGLFYYNDKSGNIDFGLSYVGLSGAYGVKMSKEIYFSGGLQLAYGQRSAKIENLRWDSQYNGFFYDGSLPTNETIGSNQTSFFDASAGVVVNVSGKKSMYGQFGLAVFHINQPNQTLLADQKDPLFRKYVMHGEWNLFIENFDFVPQFYVAKQGGSIEATAGAWFQYVSGLDSRHTNANTSSTFKLGCFYRYGDAIIPAAQMEWKRRVGVGVSYDINVSSLNLGTQYRGGVEISLYYKTKFTNNKRKV
ncbi:MAG: PorP/SprF family type IX secretion system membrane protein [Flavobacteriales bacterium]|nr:PorP/SprF family type IX secretion system membrane protein [Flavobacteriales bacterium]